jgi:hypothetical protein
MVRKKRWLILIIFIFLCDRFTFNCRGVPGLVFYVSFDSRNLCDRYVWPQYTQTNSCVCVCLLRSPATTQVEVHRLAAMNHIARKRHFDKEMTWKPNFDHKQMLLSKIWSFINFYLSV